MGCVVGSEVGGTFVGGTAGVGASVGDRSVGCVVGAGVGGISVGGTVEWAVVGSFGPAAMVDVPVALSSSDAGTAPASDAAFGGVAVAVPDETRPRAGGVRSFDESSPRPNNSFAP